MGQTPPPIKAHSPSPEEIGSPPDAEAMLEARVEPSPALLLSGALEILLASCLDPAVALLDGETSAPTGKPGTVAPSA
jgi:hypothetical protein